MKFDKQRLQQVVLNLASNAFKFTQEGVVTIQARVIIKHRDLQKRNFIEICVADSGIGIDPAEMDQIFVAFGQRN